MLTVTESETALEFDTEVLLDTASALELARLVLRDPWTDLESAVLTG